MFEQPRLDRVAIRCRQCHRGYDLPPLLGEALRLDDGSWRVGVALPRLGRKAAETAVSPDSPLLQRLRAESKTGVLGLFRDARSRTVFVAVQPEQDANLTCPGQGAAQGCTPRPPMSRAALVKLVEEALERGDHDVYV